MERSLRLQHHWGYYYYFSWLRQVAAAPSGQVFTLTHALWHFEQRSWKVGGEYHLLQRFLRGKFKSMFSTIIYYDAFKRSRLESALTDANFISTFSQNRNRQSAVDVFVIVEVEQHSLPWISKTLLNCCVPIGNFLYLLVCIDQLYHGTVL